MDVLPACVCGVRSPGTGANAVMSSRQLSLCSPGCSRIYYVDQAVFKLTEICLPRAGIRGVHHHTWPLLCMHACIYIVSVGCL